VNPSGGVYIFEFDIGKETIKDFDKDYEAFTETIRPKEAG
jgi:hypothetical protein